MNAAEPQAARDAADPSLTEELLLEIRDTLRVLEKRSRPLHVGYPAALHVRSDLERLRSEVDDGTHVASTGRPPLGQ